ncbi:hypothetical protein ACTOB_003367 [Actinoplanes oblitus]|uniref:Secreted protein n=1 Tax=Actinoplanes oblitus TaxID=3040509 RepID=A0ABY8WQI5_9ACTN|nr:hypothetical protein [Actinoplanes oblitus]WIM99707.1 hypothetical protein ACTOB_003367 [Actinoplanes oblitus]
MNVMSQMLLADPRPMAIWLVLVLVSVPALLLLGDPEAMRDPVRTVLDALRRERPEPLAAGWAAAEAARADRLAQHWQEVARDAEAHADEAWQGWQRAEERVGRARAAAAFATPDAPRTAAEYADRERFLHRSVRAAVERGDLPATAVRAGWDPRLHPVEQELVLLRAVATHRRQVFRQAEAAARRGEREAELAIAARERLRRQVTPAPSVRRGRLIASLQRPAQIIFGTGHAVTP